MATKQPFRFLDLPAELRLKCYLPIVQCTQTWGIFASQPQPKYIPIDSYIHLSIKPTFPHALLLTCSLIYHELRPLYFSHNKFCLYIRKQNTSWSSYFLAPSFRDNLYHIQTLQIHLIRWGTKRFFADELVPVIEDCILNGSLRHLEVWVRKVDIETLRSGVKGDGEEFVRWRALKRLCFDPYLKSVVFKHEHEGVGGIDMKHGGEVAYEENLRLLAAC